jgi:hypothetical protein
MDKKDERIVLHTVDLLLKDKKKKGEDELLREKLLAVLFLGGKGTYKTMGTNIRSSDTPLVTSTTHLRLLQHPQHLSQNK